ncbi:hypothetical protein CRG98_050385, partial [Punica granatum]
KSPATSSESGHHHQVSRPPLFSCEEREEVDWRGGRLIADHHLPIKVAGDLNQCGGRGVRVQRAAHPFDLPPLSLSERREVLLISGGGGLDLGHHRPYEVTGNL